jgi:hypothetical protein
MNAHWELTERLCLAEITRTHQKSIKRGCTFPGTLARASVMPEDLTASIGKSLPVKTSNRKHDVALVQAMLYTITGPDGKPYLQFKN